MEVLKERTDGHHLGPSGKRWIRNENPNRSTVHSLHFCADSSNHRLQLRLRLHLHLHLRLHLRKGRTTKEVSGGGGMWQEVSGPSAGLVSFFRLWVCASCLLPLATLATCHLTTNANHFKLPDPKIQKKKINKKYKGFSCGSPGKRSHFLGRKGLCLIYLIWIWK